MNKSTGRWIEPIVKPDPEVQELQKRSGNFDPPVKRRPGRPKGSKTKKKK
ncbi:MAG: hypothetical protein SWH78_04280 [Thermodesulfobacteriota bacterium]|nr:hypothetical protein [Thermodesulfobacteriota bacterium]